MLGEFVVVCLCDIWGLPQFSLIATICTMLCLYINFKQDYLFTFHKILTFMLGFPKHTFRIEFITKRYEDLNHSGAIFLGVLLNADIFDDFYEPDLHVPMEDLLFKVSHLQRAYLLSLYVKDLSLSKMASHIMMAEL